VLGRFLLLQNRHTFHPGNNPTIQFAKIQQSYNRYSYVSNNPLKYTDPTGYVIEEILDIFDRFTKNNETQKNKIQDDSQQKEKLERKKAEADASATTSTNSASAGGTINPSSQGNNFVGANPKSTGNVWEDMKAGAAAEQHFYLTNEVKSAPDSAAGAAGVAANILGRSLSLGAIGGSMMRPVAGARVMATPRNKGAGGASSDFKTNTEERLRGTQNPKVAEAAAMGRQIHKEFDYGFGFEKEVTL
jgi:hypothetical protein